MKTHVREVKGCMLSCSGVGTRISEDSTRQATAACESGWCSKSPDETLSHSSEQDDNAGMPLVYLLGKATLAEGSQYC